jgi:glucose/mannose-6-phosphate isomerase
MLDDLQYIHERDAQDALGIAEHQHEQLRFEFVIDKFNFEPSTIVYAGMGGSALAALLSTTWPGYKIPFEVVRNYDIPAYVSSETLFIASSYSGNTEETLSALAQAEEAGARIAIISGGGKLVEKARQKGYPLALLPQSGQPRYAVLYNFKALLSLLNAANVVSDAELHKPLELAADFLQRATQKWRADVATKSNPAKQLAQELMGKSIVVYGGPRMFPAAYKWKISFNENAKQLAWTNQLPEFNHNEFIGWSKQPVDKPYAVIDLRSNMEHERVQKRFIITEQLLSGMRPTPFIVEVEGETLLEQLLWTVAYGDFVSIYLALLNGLNPDPVELVEKFKKAMEQ